jgi:hypothetical protein
MWASYRLTAASAIPSRMGDNSLSEITIRVAGRPPPKSEAKSVFAQGGKYEPRVKALLEAAREEITRLAFQGFGSTKLRLDVEVHTGPGDPPWDATNYLGGIADVLESKTKRLIAQPGSIDHFGDLAQVGLYDDDRQIKEIIYREVQGDQAEYILKLTALSDRETSPG